MSHAAADVVVAGGGPLAAAVAATLARRSRLRVLLAMDKAASRAGIAGIGAIHALHDDSERTDLAARSFARHLEGSGAVAFRRTGFLHLTPPGGARELRRRAELLRTLDVPHESLSESEGRLRFPHLSWDGVEAAIHEPFAGVADPARTTQAWIETASRHGAAVEEIGRAREILVEAGRVTGLRGTVAEIRTPTVVVIEGTWSKKLTSAAGVAPRTAEVRVQMNRYSWLPLASSHPAFADGRTGLRGWSGPTEFCTRFAAREHDLRSDGEAWERTLARTTTRLSHLRVPILADLKMADVIRGTDHLVDGGAHVIEEAGAGGLWIARCDSTSALACAPALADTVADRLR